MPRPSTPESLRVRAAVERAIASAPQSVQWMAEEIGVGRNAIWSALQYLRRNGLARPVRLGVWAACDLMAKPSALAMHPTQMVRGRGDRRETCDRYSECMMGYALRSAGPGCCPLGCSGYVRRLTHDEAHAAMRGEGWQA